MRLRAFEFPTFAQKFSIWDHTILSFVEMLLYITILS